MATNGVASTPVSSNVGWRDEFLRDLAALRKKGKSNQLSEEQMDNLFSRSKWFDKPSSNRVFFRQMIKAIKYLIYGMTLVVCLVIGLNQFQRFYEYFDGSVEYLNIGEYNFTRFTRLFAVDTGLREWMIGQKWNTDSCFLDNPLYLRPKPPCTLECHNASFKEYLPADVDALRKIKYRDEKQVFIYRSSATASDITLTGLKEILLTHADEVGRRVEIFQSTVDGFNTIQDLLNASDPEQMLAGFDEGLVAIGAAHYNISRHFRRLFARAPFVPLEAEIQLDRRVFVIGTNTTFRIEDPKDYEPGHNWIHQARGSQCFAVRQLDECKGKARIRKKLELKKSREEAEKLIDGQSDNDDSDEVKDKLCPTFSFRLEEGDFAYYNGYHWYARSYPCDEGNESKQRSDGRDTEETNGVDGSRELGKAEVNYDRIKNVKRNYGLIYVGKFA